MLAREIFYHFSEEKKEGIFTRIDNWLTNRTSNNTPVTTDTTSSPDTPGTDSADTTNSGTTAPATSTTTTSDPYQSSYKIPILSRFNGAPGQSNSQSVLNAGLTVTTPSRRV